MDRSEEEADIFRQRQQAMEYLANAVAKKLPKLSEIERVVIAISNALGSVAEALSPWLENSERIAQALKELPSKHREVLRMLADRGWYFDGEMAFTMPETLIETFRRDNGEDEVETMLKEHFSVRVREIEKFLIEQLPSRAGILQQALQAHRDGQYALSTPIFLMQADGVCHARTGRYFFMRDKGLPQTATYVATREVDEWESAWLSPLAAIGQINMSEKQRGTDFVGLNRHLVIHGDSVDYGTETNSLKALSLLNFIVQILKSEDV